MKTNEIIAQALKANQHWTYATPGVPYELADNIEQALSAAGLVIVPREATTGMLDAACAVVSPVTRNYRGRKKHYYKAMITAHEKEITAAETE